MNELLNEVDVLTTVGLHTAMAIEGKKVLNPELTRQLSY